MVIPSQLDYTVGIRKTGHSKSGIIRKPDILKVASHHSRTGQKCPVFERLRLAGTVWSNLCVGIVVYMFISDSSDLA